nr:MULTISPECIES: hypothetical protein [Bacillus cereus group]
MTPAPSGLTPTGIVVITVFVKPSITETLLLLRFVIKIRSVKGLTPTANGPVPTEMVAITALFAPSMTDTLLLP